MLNLFNRKKIFALIFVFLLLCVNKVAAETTTADIVFFVDASGSMTGYIDAVRTNVSAFAKQLVSDGVDSRFLVISFADGYSNDIYVHNVVINDWTSDYTKVESLLASIDVYGNETQTHALNQTFSSVTFRDNAEKFGFLLTDEPTSSSDHSQYFPNEIFVTIDELVPKFKNINMPVSVISETLLKEHYTNLFANTGGVFVDITQ